MVALRDRVDSLMARNRITWGRLPAREEHGRGAARLPPRNRVSVDGAVPDRAERRQRWVAFCLRRAYGLGWVPEDLTAHIVHIVWDAHDEALVLPLDTGARLVDRYDSIEVLGVVDSIAIAELVACVQRRGWQQVRVHGGPEFRAAAARALVAAGIEVLDPPVGQTDLGYSAAPFGSLPVPRSEQQPSPPAGPFGRA